MRKTPWRLEMLSAVLFLGAWSLFGAESAAVFGVLVLLFLSEFHSTEE